MTTEQFLYKALLVGYVLAGISGVGAISDKSVLERPGFMIQLTFLKRVVYGAFWFVFLAIESYFAFASDKAKGAVFAVLSPPIMWLGFSVLGAAGLYPHLVIASKPLAILASVAIFSISGFFLSPLIGMLCAGLTLVIANPIVALLPKK